MPIVSWLAADCCTFRALVGDVNIVQGLWQLHTALSLGNWPQPLLNVQDLCIVQPSQETSTDDEDFCLGSAACTQ